ncbi:MAG: alpha/beta fold hydrolase [Ignavibacteriae bacterium]|nr:alpha/beta fold hydrolase [Ignavibacteriota bacterium]
MNLFFHSYGKTGRPLIILHGLLGSADNWHTHGKLFGERFRVFALDARNHGRSPHANTMSYAEMANDVREFMHSHNLPAAHILGHSMGGKTSMHFALTYPELVEKLIVVDMAPRGYGRQHDYIFDAVTSLNLNNFTSRKEISEALSANIPSETTRQFVMKNLAREDSGGFRWKMNLPVILRYYNDINGALDSPTPFIKPALLLKSNKAGYVTQEDEPSIMRLFPQARIVGVDVGHWIHAEAPEEFAQIVLEFLLSKGEYT